jgi:phosphatidylserine decarboxylase
MAELPRVRDRITGEIITERVFGAKELSLLYERRVGRWITNQLLSRQLPSRIYGWLQRRPVSRRKIAEFVESLGVNTEEAEFPVDHYRSLNDFFTRRLKPEARPIDPNPEYLVSPADGRTLVYPCLEQQQLLIKGSRVSLGELLNDRELAQRYAGGSVIVIRLAPADYHRFHFPDDGIAGPGVPIHGRLHSVHPIALAAAAPSFRNKRVFTDFQCSCGSLALLEIGALCVGTIVQTYRPGTVRRGQEKGYFQFGGSTVVMLAGEGRLQIDDDLIRASMDGIETQVRMGTRIARIR